MTITKNMIVHNVAGWSGGGVALQDATNSKIVNNTIANNDTTATVGALVAAHNSTPQPAGIASDHNSPDLAGAAGGADYSDPVLVNNIIWHNRAFTYDATAGAAKLLPELSPATIGNCPTATNYLDLGVLGGGSLNPTYSILTDITGYDGSNLLGDPDFLVEYCNGARTLSAPGPMQMAAEVIEGGNFIDVRYGPLTRAWPEDSAPWNYHVPLLDPGGVQVINGTRYVDDDLLGHAERNLSHQFEKLILDAGVDLVTDERGGFQLVGDPVFEHLDKPFLQKQLSIIGPKRFSAQYLIRCLATGMAIFDRRHFKSMRWEDSMRDYAWYVLTDSAVSEREDGCYSAIGLVGLDSVNNAYVADVRVGHWAPTEFRKQMFEVLDRWLPRLMIRSILMESIAMNRVFKSMIEEEARKRQMRVNLVDVMRGAPLCMTMGQSALPQH